MEPKSEASTAALYSLNMHDERASFCMAYPGNCRGHESIVDDMHSYDDDIPVVRRWWTDAAPEFAKAARIIRSLRPLAHYKSAPYRPQANGRAERFNRLLVEVTRCFLLQSGLGERWWPLAIVLFFVNFNAVYRGPDGLSPWIRRFSTSHEFRPYPFGALVLYVHPKDSLFPGPKNKDGLTTKQLRNRLAPAIFVGISVGPGCQ